ncbi:spore germination protein [Virgibacillus natechei]|uniref:Spore germination protein n=1 Tax=Virgibacillus natechei TaxID=1216297 RepID=A0ABS4IFB2_9BACI|nr:germination protein YpeB [Virgibacillus natechei]MBP1969629.1 spore germination protein [Virgibacillus natechei]UZD11357.1 germination protein YpeB [Virgibacillus natechei]
MIRWILIAVLTIGIAGTGFWGYQEQQEKNDVLIQAENTYQRSFHELSYHVDLLNDKIGSALAMNSEQRLSPQLVDIWRLTSEALANVGQLPLGVLPFNKTEQYLSNIGDFMYQTAVRDLEDAPLTDEETESLENLYEQSGEIKDELRQVQHVVLDNNLRWMDVQVALDNQEDQEDNTIVDGFESVENSMDGYSETNIDSPIVGSSSQEQHEFKFLEGDNVTEEEALAFSKEEFNVENEENLSLTQTGEGSDIPMYSISYENDEKRAYMDMSVQGGHPITMLVDRPVEDQQMSLNEGLEVATDYIEENEFENMTIFESNEYNNVGFYAFLSNENDVRIFSDAIEVKVALDDGEILGITSRNYFMNHTDRDIPEPEISEEEAKEMVNPHVEIQEEFLAVIDDDEGEEVLTYEFLGVMGNETYRIFINAMNGREEEVEKLDGTEINYGGNNI